MNPNSRPDEEDEVSTCDPDVSVTLGPISSTLLWPPGPPVVAAVEWRAPELKSADTWTRATGYEHHGSGPTGHTLHERMGLKINPHLRCSMRVEP